MGQLVPFPAPRAAAKRYRPLPASSGRLIALIPPSRLYVAGMAAICPTLKVVAKRLGEIGDPERPARERVVERLFQALPDLPRVPDTAALERLLDGPFEDVCRLAAAQVARGPQDRRLYALGQSIWRDIDRPDLREFAQRCSVFLVEAHHLANQMARTDDLAESA